MSDYFVVEEPVVTKSAPYSREAEDGLLGAVQINPECVPQIRAIINKPDDFFLHRNRWVWEAVCTLDDKNIPIDILTLSEELNKLGRLSEVGGTAYLTALLNQSPNSLHAEHYANIIHMHGVRRRMIAAANSVAKYAYDEAMEIESVVAQSIEEVQQAANGLLGGRAVDARELASLYYDEVDNRAKDKSMPGIPTGFFKLDILFGGGLQPGEFTLAAGFPGIGKTSFLDTIAYHVAKTYHVGLFPLEMSNKEQTNRFLAQETGINSQRLRSGKLEEREYPIFTHAIEEFADLKLKMDDTTPLSMASLRAKCVQWRSQKKLDLIVVDYAGLLDGIGKSEYELFSYLSKNLKFLARETGCHVLAAHQLNRKGREYEKPSIHHLRGSGTWEQDADNVLLIYEPKDGSTNEFLPRTLEIAKQRNGPVGTVDLLMKRSTTKFFSSRVDKP